MGLDYYPHASPPKNIFYAIIRMTKHCAYVFTINNYTFDDILLVFDCGNQRYLCFGFEVGDQGTPHMQGYVYFVNETSFNSVRKQIPRARIDVAKGTVEQNIKYTSKDGDWYEFGKKPQQGKATWNQIEQVMQDPISNPRLYAQYKKYYRDMKQVIEKKKDTKFYVIDPINDAIGECYDYFDWSDSDKIAVVTDLNQLEAYDEYEHVIYYCDHLDRLQLLWPRKVPITYKYGYEIRKVNCSTLIIVTETPGLYTLYKNIN